MIFSEECSCEKNKNSFANKSSNKYFSPIFLKKQKTYSTFIKMQMKNTKINNLCDRFGLIKAQPRP